MTYTIQHGLVGGRLVVKSREGDAVASSTQQRLGTYLKVRINECKPVEL